MDLEICCWGSPNDLMSAFEEPSTLDAPHVVNLLESSDDEVATPINYAPAVPLYREDLHIANFGLLDSGKRNFLKFPNTSGWFIPHTTQPSFPRLFGPENGVNGQRPQPQVSVPTQPVVPTLPATQPLPQPTQAMDVSPRCAPPSPLKPCSPPNSRLVKKESSLDSTEDEMDNSDTEYTEESALEVAPGTNNASPADDSEENFKLGTSKSPVIEAFIYCALKGWGVHVKTCTRNEVEFTVSDFDRYYSASNRICSKHRPTEDISARIKGLKRWFPDFPARKSQISESFTVSVGKDKNKLSKIRQILHKNRELAGICKLRRSR